MTGAVQAVPTNVRELAETMYRSALRMPSGQLRFLPFILREPIERFLPRLNAGRFISQVTQLENFYVLRLHRTDITDSAGEPIIGEFALFPVRGSVWSFCAAEKSAVVHKTAARAIQLYASRASTIFISTKEFARFFGSLSSDGKRLLVFRHDEYNRQQSTMNFLRERRDYRTVFKELAAKDAVLTRITAGIYANNEQLIRFSCTNNSLISLRSGDLAFFLERVLGEVARIGDLRSILFADRERDKQTLHPLHVSFDSDVLSDRIGNFQLIDSLASIGRSAIAVFHANPYVHVLYTDFRDGSSFNVYSTSESSLAIVPSTRASVSAIMRLYRGISERFADCEVSETPVTQQTIGDFFTE